MRLCVMVEGQEGVTWEDWLALARACEWNSEPFSFEGEHHRLVDSEPRPTPVQSPR